MTAATAADPADPALPAEPDIAPVPDISGHFSARGIAYGGRFAPEALMAALDELTGAYRQARNDLAFRAELDGLLTGYAGRPTLLTRAARFSEQAGGAAVLLKREDLTHTGSHKINNVLGQVLLARRMGKTRVIAETGAGQHGVATATAAALLGDPDRADHEVAGGVGHRGDVGLGGAGVRRVPRRHGSLPGGLRGGRLGHPRSPRSAGCEPAVTRSATAQRGSFSVTRLSPTSTASAPDAA